MDMADLDAVVARNVTELRTERGWSQKELAALMAVSGMRWTPNRVSQIETLRGSLGTLELLALAWTFGVPVERLLHGDEGIDLPDGSTVTLEVLRQVIAGEAAERDVSSIPVSDVVRDEELRKLAGRVNLQPYVLDWLAEQLWGRSFMGERDHRAGDLSGKSERSARAYKAHATKRMMSEVEAALTARGANRVTLMATHDAMKGTGR